MPISRSAGCRLIPGVLACLCVWAGPLCWPLLAIGGDEGRTILFAPLPDSNAATDQLPRASTSRQVPSVADQDLLSSAFAPLDDEPEIRYNGTPVPGTRVTLALSESDDPNATYRWMQIEGPKVEIDDPSKPRITLTVPRGAERLRFLLTMNDRNGGRSVRVTVPIGPEVPVEASVPRADPGGDQTSLVGQTVLLNGSGSSVPAIKAGSYRWIQVAGPKVEATYPDNQSLSFTPSQAGVYRFLLMVSANDVISEPNQVSVTVREPVSSAGPSGRSAVRTTNGVSPVPPAPSVPSNKPIGEQIADVFDAVADRAGLFSSFDTVTSEMTRRLDVIVPRDPALRLLWSQKLFVPLSQRTAAEMSTLGLDLRTPLGHQRLMTDIQKERLGKLFQTYAEELRAASRLR